MTIRDRTAQKAVVCLYLRYRRARRHAHAMRQQFPPDHWLTLTANAYEDEAWNALVSVERVLYHDNWD